MTQQHTQRRQFTSMLDFCEFIHAEGGVEAARLCRRDQDAGRPWPSDGKIAVPPELYREWCDSNAERRAALWNYATGKGPRPWQ